MAIVGASTTYGLAWLVLLVIPMLAVVQAVAARLGAVSNRGLENAIRARYGRPLALLALFAALQVMTGVAYRWFVVPLALITASPLIFARYDAIARVLKYLAFIFFAYAIAAFLAHPNWGDVLRGSLVPHFELRSAYVSGAIALLGMSEGHRIPPTLACAGWGVTAIVVAAAGIYLYQTFTGTGG